MRSRSVCRAEDLAGYLEVSLSTIYRDIAHLQASGLPIEGEPGVGYILRPGFDLPNTTFTHDQVDALAIGLAFVERTGDPELSLAAKEVRAKLQAVMPRPDERKLLDAPYFSLQQNSVVPKMARSIRASIQRQEFVDVIYQNASGERTERRLRPILVWDLGQGWMVSAWCELRQGFRTFRSDRILRLSCSGEKFPFDVDKGLGSFLAHDDCSA